MKLLLRMMNKVFLEKKLKKKLLSMSLKNLKLILKKSLNLDNLKIGTLLQFIDMKMKLL